jgi:hypothetical protein
VHQGPVIRKGNELDVARADLTRALRRVARATAGEDASFAQLEDAALEAADEAVRDFCEQELQRIEDSFDDELLINGVLFKRSHAPAQGDYRSLCGNGRTNSIWTTRRSTVSSSTSTSEPGCMQATPGPRCSTR